jgi:hypothetical protein
MFTLCSLALRIPEYNKGRTKSYTANFSKCIIRCNFKCGLNVRLLGVGMASEEGCSKLMGTDSRCAHICLP